MWPYKSEPRLVHHFASGVGIIWAYMTSSFLLMEDLIVDSDMNRKHEILTYARLCLCQTSPDLLN